MEDTSTPLPGSISSLSLLCDQSEVRCKLVPHKTFGNQQLNSMNIQFPISGEPLHFLYPAPSTFFFPLHSLITWHSLLQAPHFSALSLFLLPTIPPSASSFHSPLSSLIRFCYRTSLSSPLAISRLNIANVLSPTSLGGGIKSGK